MQPASTNKEFSILWTCFPIPCFVACSCLQSVLCTPKEFAFQAAGIWELSLGLGTLIPSGGQSQIGDPSRLDGMSPLQESDNTGCRSGISNLFLHHFFCALLRLHSDQSVLVGAEVRSMSQETCFGMTMYLGSAAIPGLLIELYLCQVKRTLNHGLRSHRCGLVEVTP
jgi:hypothetical protein